MQTTQIIKKNFSTLTFIAVTLVTTITSAQISVYTGESGEKMFIQNTPDLGKETALVKFEGVPQSKWQNNVIQVKKTTSSAGARYSFDYDLVLSNGTHKRTYTLAAESGSKLIKGTQAKKIELYIQDTKNPVEFFHDLDLTKSSQSVDLKTDFKKSQFKPDVD